MGLDIEDMLSHGASGVKIYNADRLIEAEMVIQLYEEFLREHKDTQYLNKDGKLREEVKTWLTAKVENSLTSEEERKYRYCTDQLKDKIYSRLVIIETEKVIHFLKSYIRDNEQYAKNLDFSQGCDLHLMQAKSDLPENLTSFKDSYILLSDRLIYVRSNTAIEEVNIKDKEKFLKDLVSINVRNAKAIHLSERQVTGLITANGSHFPEGQVKEADKLWLMERMEGHLSSDKHRRPLYANFYIGFVFEMAVKKLDIAPHQEALQKEAAELNEMEEGRYQARL